MRDVKLNLPTLIATVGTRAMLAFGVGLLVADKIPAVRRNKIAATLIGLGAVSTVPLARAVWKGRARPIPVRVMSSGAGRVVGRGSSLPPWS